MATDPPTGHADSGRNLGGSHAVAGQHGAGKIARLLGLDYYALRKRLEPNRESQRPGSPFVEVIPSLWAPGCDLNEVRHHFPDADQYKSLLIFNIRRNHYRLIVKGDYKARLLKIKGFLIKGFLPHADYARGDWKKWAR